MTDEGPDAERELRDIARRLQGDGWSFELCDADWTLLAVSDQIKEFIGVDDDEELGVGRHFLESRRQPAWERAFPPGSEAPWLESVGPHMLRTVPGGRDALKRMARPQSAATIDGLEPAQPTPVWGSSFDAVAPDGGPPARINFVVVELRAGDGRLIGYAIFYASALRSLLLTMLVRGDEGMFERMARLHDPARHEAAIVFADLQASAQLSRRLPSAAFFELIRAFTTAIDDAVVRHGGIVSKHAGDGVTAFFLVRDLGTRSDAVRSAIEMARAVVDSAADAAGAAGHGDKLGALDTAVNIGVHWGGALYLGQVVTGGRLEVTALGDEVNECARMQQTAVDGALLASKPLLERLDDDAAAALGIDPDALVYRQLGEFEGAGEKAVRDAGSVPVVDLRGGAG